MKKMLLLITLILFSISVFSQEKIRQRESYYQAAFAFVVDGESEVVLKDKTRADIITATHAIEVDFAEKWAESIGQALHYEEMTGKKAGVLLVVEEFKDTRYLDRLMPIAIKHGIDVWTWDWTTDRWGRVDYKIEYIY
jgi:hypothetical protein